MSHDATNPLPERGTSLISTGSRPRRDPALVTEEAQSTPPDFTKHQMIYKMLFKAMCR